MKVKTREFYAKIFAVLVILLMIFQVLLPLFNSATPKTTTADITSSTSEVEVSTAAQPEAGTPTPLNTGN